jgi:hypothetical protein
VGIGTLPRVGVLVHCTNTTRCVKIAAQLLLANSQDDIEGSEKLELPIFSLFALAGAFIKARATFLPYCRPSAQLGLGQS